MNGRTGSPVGYGEIIRAERQKLGLTQRQLGETIGCTDGYLAHLENEMKVPSIPICLALADQFDLTPKRRQALIESVEHSRSERSERRIRARGAAVRHALQSDGQQSENKSRDAMTPQRIARALRSDPDLEEAFTNLLMALSDPAMRPTAINTLRALAKSTQAK